ncbi:AraC family transcriptional regulator [Sorangium atrum]|uniref:AraC family transcriptional regulator n=1 Tax=Sorangium atrum TaxID=2995308 RepID=A0ABT5BYT8_9BACT|nr:AraC family transcriptional regulator [Sorangium aterium]MDC0679320.1 AraC family transcriptional regulator [Sorangium aterium]
MPPRGTKDATPSHSAAAGAFLSILTFADQLAPGAASRLRAEVLAGIALDGVDARGPAEKLPELLAAAVELTRVDDLGLRLAKAADPRRFGVATYAASTSPTLRAAYERAARYFRLWNEGVRLELERDRAARLTSIVLRSQGKTAMAAPEGRRQLAELGSATMLMLGRSFTGAPISPARVELASAAPADVRPHERIFAAPIAWSAPVPRLIFDDAALDQPLPQHDAVLQEIVSRSAEALLAALATKETWSARTREALLGLLRDGSPDIARVAKSLGTSRRTLQRRLTSEGQTFESVIDQVRYEMAAGLLADEQRSIAEVAWLVGFRELSAFYRAFRRWSGRTPAEYRASLSPGATTQPRPDEAPARRVP